jgi:hypothetical protein
MHRLKAFPAHNHRGRSLIRRCVLHFFDRCPEELSAGCATLESEVIVEALRYSYNTGRGGSVDGVGYPACSWGVSFCGKIW